MMDALQLWEKRKKTLHVFCGFFYDKLSIQSICLYHVTVACAIEHILQYIEWILKGKMYTFFSLCLKSNFH
jgi:hypothetical protein